MAEAPKASRVSGLLALVAAATGATGLSFTLPPASDVGASKRCIHETVPHRSLIAGDWEITASNSKIIESASGSSSSSLSSSAGRPCELKILDPSGSVAFSNSELTGHFAVHAHSAGMHKICVSNSAGEERKVMINIRLALQVDDHETVAKKEHIEAIEAELDRMRNMAVHVYEEMIYMRRRADQQHATNASTRGRLLWVEVCMMFAVLLMGLWQIRYLRNYFKVKKLI